MTTNKPARFQVAFVEQEVTVRTESPGNDDFFDQLAEASGAKGVDYPDSTSIVLDYRFGTEIEYSFTRTALTLGYVLEGEWWVLNAWLDYVIEVTGAPVPLEMWGNRRDVIVMSKGKVEFPGAFRFTIREQLPDDDLLGIFHGTGERGPGVMDLLCSVKDSICKKRGGGVRGTLENFIVRCLSLGYVAAGQEPDLIFCQNDNLVKFMK